MNIHIYIIPNMYIECILNAYILGMYVGKCSYIRTYSIDVFIYVHQKICTIMFKAALLLN